MDTLKSNMLPGALEAGTVDGKLYGLLSSANVKSLVFYNKKAFDKAGYKAPTSIAELEALTEQIKDDGHVPVVHGHREPTPPPAGRPPTGSRTWSCSTAAPTSTTTGSPTRSRSTTRW